MRLALTSSKDAISKGYWHMENYPAADISLLRIGKQYKALVHVSCRPDLVVDDLSCKCGAARGWRKRFRGFPNLGFFLQAAGPVSIWRRHRAPSKHSPKNSKVQHFCLFFSLIGVLIVGKSNFMPWGEDAIGFLASQPSPLQLSCNRRIIHSTFHRSSSRLFNHRCISLELQILSFYNHEVQVEHAP